MCAERSCCRSPDSFWSHVYKREPRWWMTAALYCVFGTSGCLLVTSCVLEEVSHFRSVMLLWIYAGLKVKLWVMIDRYGIARWYNDDTDT